MKSQDQNLMAWGWSPYWDFAWRSVSGVPGRDLVPARVIGRDGPTLLLATAQGSRHGWVSGKRQYRASEGDLPIVGDWVAVHVVDDALAVVHEVLPRATVFRRAAGSKQPAVRERLVAANLDVLAIVMGLDCNFNPRRAQRLSTLARAGRIEPLWILSKADLGRPDLITTAALAAGRDPIVIVSATTGKGIEDLRAWFKVGQTIGLAGSSGVGKTTLVNALLGTHLSVQEVREGDSKGRHTTTSRHLYRVPEGGILMDSPGLRSVGLWADRKDLATSFSDLEELAARCRFQDCRHQGEPGCAVRSALESGELEPSRWDGWQRQSREVLYHEQTERLGSQRAERERWKPIHRGKRHFSKEGRSRADDGALQ